jgi:hypothetical protein
MNRHAAAIAIALCLSPSMLRAQAIVFTVNDAPAEIHKGPSTVNPVIGTAPHGAVLEVTRELGSWVRIVWPAAEDGVGYVHVSSGSIRHGATTAQSNGGAAIPPRPPARTASRGAASGSAPPPMRVDAGHSGPAGEPAALARYVSRPTHIIGIGALTGGPTLHFGGTARAWSRRQFGVQFEMSRESAGDITAQQVRSTQFTPSVLYSLPSHLTDYFWMRPYVGGGASLQHQTLRDATTGINVGIAENRLGFQTFGGAETTFAAAPRFSVSADLGYRWRPTDFTGVELGGLAVSVSAHWYVK